MRVTRLKNANITKVDIVPLGAQQHSKISIKKSYEEGSKMNEDRLNQLEKVLDKLLELLDQEPDVKEPEVKEPEVKEPEVKEPEVKEPEVKEPANEPDVKEPEVKDEPVEKSYVRKMQELEEANRELLLKLAKAEEEAEKKEYIQKAANFQVPGMKQSEIAEIMYTVKKSCKSDEYEKFEQALGKISAVIKSSDMFTSLGTSKDAIATNADEIWAQIEKLADSKVQKSNISRTQAMTEVLRSEEGKRLYMEYRKLQAKEG